MEGRKGGREERERTRLLRHLLLGVVRLLAAISHLRLLRRIVCIPMIRG